MEIKGKKILIVEDNPIIAADLESFLSSEGLDVVAVAHEASHALDHLNKPDIEFAILDIHLGTGPSGLDIAEVIHEKYHLPYIFLTSFDDEATLAEAQRHAPYGYLVKPFQERTILATIKMALLNFEKSKNQLDSSRDHIDSISTSPLTEQEHTVLKKLLEAKSYKQIAASCFISINTVKFHAKNIYAKLDVSSRIELISKLG